MGIRLPSTVEGQTEYLEELGNKLVELDKQKNKALLDQCKILYEVNLVWDDVEMETQGFWDYDFFVWAGRYTQNEHVHTPARSTIENKIYVWRDYVAEGNIKLPEKVRILKTSKTGKPLGDGSEPQHWKTINTPDVRTVSYTKLLTIRTEALAGEVDDEVWSHVFDNTKTVGNLNAKIKGLESNKAYLVEEQGIVMVRNKDGQERIISVIMFEEEDELWREGIALLLKTIKDKTTV